MSRSRVARAVGWVVARLSGVVVVVAAVAALLAAPLAVVVVAGAQTVDQVEHTFLDPPPLPDELPTAATLSTVHDRDGERIAELAGEVRREPVPLDEVPKVVIDAVLATEDTGFYEHPGVEHQAMARAAAANVAARAIAEGASTITQQYVRMTLLSPEQTLQRKLDEVLLAVQLERRQDKDEILEGYLNRVYLGQGVYGFGTAADHYLSKPLAELDVAEAALLAGTIRTPATTNPVTDPEAARDRRDVVLRQMQAQGRISLDAAEAAMAREVELDVRDHAPGEPFWVDLVKRLVYDPRADLQPGLQEAVGATTQDRIDALFAGGLRIETTLDRAMNEHAEATLAGYLTDPSDDPMGAVLSADHTTGALRVIALGPRDFGVCEEDHDGPCELTQVNPTVPWGGGSGRQSGSAFKPFVAAAALEDGFEDDDLEYDTPSGETIEGCGAEGEDDYEPENYDLEDHGEIELDEAMRRSTNTYFVQLGRDVGIERVVASAQRHGLVWSPNLDGFGSRSCSLSIGTAEVFPLELVTGYGTWANDGVTCQPYVIERVLDADGEVLYEHEPDCERATDRDVAAAMRELLREPVGPSGTAGVVGARVPDAFGKTGTTDRHVDAWFVGASGGLTTAAWVGYERPAPMRDVTIGGTYYPRVTGGVLPAHIWADVHADLP
jgi:penicillin-binding protein 1A